MYCCSSSELAAERERADAGRPRGDADLQLPVPAGFPVEPRAARGGQVATLPGTRRVRVD